MYDVKLEYLYVVIVRIQISGVGRVNTPDQAQLDQQASDSQQRAKAAKSRLPPPSKVQEMCIDRRWAVVNPCTIPSISFTVSHSC